MVFVLNFAIYNGPKCSAEVLSKSPKCTKAVMCLMEKMHMLDKLCPGISHVLLVMTSKVIGQNISI